LSAVNQFEARLAVAKT